MSARGYKLVGRWQDNWPGGRSVVARLDDGREYWLSISRGQRVRVPYRQRTDPRGMFGFRMVGVVRDRATGLDVWRGQVNKSDGAQYLLECAGLLGGEVAS